MRALLDTSVLIARGQGGPLADLAAEEAISVVTIAELHIGVLVAADPDVRAQRLRTLAEVESAYEPIPIDEDVARAFAGLVATARARGSKPKILDALIAATAMAHGVPLVTQDADFEDFAGIEMVRL